MKFMIFEAHLEKDVNFFLTMNPYYQITYMNQTIKGLPHFDAGKEPIWSDFDSVNHTINVTNPDG